MKKLFLIFIPVMLIVAANAQRVLVKISALPDPLPRFFNASYPGFAIDTAYTIVSNNKVTYETIITKGTIRETLVFDENGTFLHKYQVEKNRVERANIDAAQPLVNKKNNTAKKQPILKIKNAAKKDNDGPDEPIQMNKPDKMPAKK